MVSIQSFPEAEALQGVRANFEILHGRGAENAPLYPSGFDLIPRILPRHRISACIDDLPPKWITQIGDTRCFHERHRQNRIAAHTAKIHAYELRELTHRLGEDFHEESSTSFEPAGSFGWRRQDEAPVGPGARRFRHFRTGIRSMGRHEHQGPRSPRRRPRCAPEGRRSSQHRRVAEAAQQGRPGRPDRQADGRRSRCPPAELRRIHGQARTDGRASAVRRRLPARPGLQQHRSRH